MKMTVFEYAGQNNEKAFNILNDFDNGKIHKIEIKKDNFFNQNIFKDNLLKPKSVSNNMEYEKGPLNFYEAILKNRVDIMEIHFRKNRWQLNKNFYYPMPPGFLYCLPLIYAIKHGAYDAFRLLLEKGQILIWNAKKLICLPNNMQRKTTKRPIR